MERRRVLDVLFLLSLLSGSLVIPGIAVSRTWRVTFLPLKLWASPSPWDRVHATTLSSLDLVLGP